MASNATLKYTEGFYEEFVLLSLCYSFPVWLSCEGEV